MPSAWYVTLDTAENGSGGLPSPRLLLEWSTQPQYAFLCWRPCPRMLRAFLLFSGEMGPHPHDSFSAASHPGYHAWDRNVGWGGVCRPWARTRTWKVESYNHYTWWSWSLTGGYMAGDHGSQVSRVMERIGYKESDSLFGKIQETRCSLVDLDCIKVPWSECFIDSDL